MNRCYSPQMEIVVPIKSDQKICKYGSDHRDRPAKKLSLNEPDRVTPLCLKDMTEEKERDVENSCHLVAAI